MTRWLFRVAVAAVGCASAASAQSLSPAALAGTRTVPAEPQPAVRSAAPEETVVLLMRTAGQPERRLRVLKHSSYPDGETLVDVKDEASGRQFTLPGKVAAALPRAGREAAPPSPAVYPPPPPQPPASRYQPPQTTTFDPPPAAPGVPSLQLPPAAQPTPPPVVPPAAKLQPPSDVEWKTLTPEPTPAARQTPLPQLPNSAPTPPAPTPPAPSAPLTPPNPAPAPHAGTLTPLTPLPSQPTVPSFNTVPPQPQLSPLPAPAPAVPGGSDRWKPITPPPAGGQPQASASEQVIRGQMPVEPLPSRPSSFASTLDRRLPTVPSVNEPNAGFLRIRTPVPPAIPVHTPAPPAAVMRTPNWTPTAPAVRVERSVATDQELADILRREMKPMADNLATALRPSVRVSAAAGLGEMRYAARPEVKEVLARAAMTDPAEAVRVECVKALGQLGYNEAAYVRYLKDVAKDGPDALRRAAFEALVRVLPRAEPMLSSR